MKKSLKAMIASASLLLATSVLAGCGNKEPMIPVASVHEHTFSENWEASDSSHWHKATCEHTDVMSNVEDHKFGAWNVTRQPSQTEEGVQERTCSVCQYVQRAAVAKLDHQHTFSQAWEADDDNHWHKATCHENVYSSFAAHTYGQWNVTVQPTETKKGIMERTCSVCNHKETAEVDKTLHVHTYASEYSVNSSSHWKAATCGHDDSFKDFDSHSFGQWEVVDESTETTNGSRQRVCGVCGYVEVEELPLAPHTHTYSTSWNKNAVEHWHDATCECAADGVRKDVSAHNWGSWNTVTAATEDAEGVKSRSCTVCGYTEEGSIEKLPHTHTYSNTWTYNSETHWHEATCGHVAKSGEAAHTKNTNEISWAGAIKCSVCGYIIQPAVKDTEKYIPSDVVTLEPNQCDAYKVTLQSDAQPRIEFAIASGSISFWLYNSDGVSVSSGGAYTATKDFVGAKTLPAGNYYLKVKAGSNGNTNVLITNYTFVYERETVSSKEIALEGAEPVEYTMYEYTARYGVDTQYNYVTIENESGEEIALFGDGKIYSQPGETVMGAWRTVNASGSTRLFYVPEFCYRSEIISSSPYTIDVANSTESNAVLKVSESNFLNILWNDTYWKGVNGYNELNAKLYAWYGSMYAQFSTTSYRKDLTTNTIVKNSTTWDWDGLFEMDFDAICEDMTYDSDTEMYKFIKSGKYASFKVTNTQASNFSIFRGFANATTYAAGVQSKGAYMTRFTYVFDANGHRVNTARSYAKINGDQGNIGYGENYASWFYSGSDTKENRFEVKPGETYYFLDYDTSSANYHATLGQTTYSVTLDPNIEGVEPMLYLDGADFRGAKYQHSYSAYDISNYLLDNVEVPEGKHFAGFAGTKTGNVMFTACPMTNNGLNGKPTIVNKNDNGTLYAKWIDSENLIMTPREITNFLSDTNAIEYHLDNIVDGNLVIKPNDAVNLVYSSGTVREQMISEVGYGSTPTEELSQEEAALHPGEKPWIVVEFPNGINGVHVGLIAAYMETEFELTLCDEDYSGIAFLPSVQKGEAATLPFYGELSEMDPDSADWGSYEVLFGEGGALEGKYFAGWSENGVDIVTLDGGEYTPIRDTELTPIYKDVEDSKLVALRYGIGFETIGGTEYLKLQVLDPNLTITTATPFTLVFSDGTTATIGVTQLLTIDGVNLPDGAKRSDGVILLNVFNFETKKADIERAIQIIAA